MENVVVEKSMDFAVRIVKLCRYLKSENKEFEISKQLLRSGTSIGANIKEAQEGQSKSDFVSKMNIALKETSETEYWLELLYRTDSITKQQYESMKDNCKELLRLLTAIVKNSKPH